MNLCVVIPVFNRRNLVLKCIEQIYRQDEIIEIVIVDDGSSDGTSQAIKENFPNVYIVVGTGNWWYTKSINEGLRFALDKIRPEAFLLLNDDVILSEKYLHQVLLHLENNKKSHIIFGSVSFDRKNKSVPTFLGIKNFIPWKNKFIKYTLKDIEAFKEKNITLIRSYFLPGRGMFFSKDTLLINGFLNERFIQYASDYEFSARGRLFNIVTCICIDAVLYSFEELTSIASPKNKPSLQLFLKGLFNPRSAIYPVNNYKIIWQHGNKLSMPLSIVIVLLGKFKAYFKYKNA